MISRARKICRCGGGGNGWPKPDKEWWDKITDGSQKGYDYRGTPEYWNEKALEGSNLDEVVEEIQEMVEKIISYCNSYRNGAHARIQLRMENFTSLEYWMNPDEHEIPQEIKDYIKELYENSANKDSFRDGYIDGEVYAVFLFAGELVSVIGIGSQAISSGANKIFSGTAQVQLAGGGTVEIPIEVESGNAAVAIIPGEGFNWDRYLQSKAQGEGDSDSNEIFQGGQNALKNFDIDDAYVKPKHLSTTGGNGAKFLGNNKSEAESILKDVIKNRTVQSITDNGITSQGKQSFEIVIDAGKIVGTKGEELVKIILSEDGGMLSAYPIK